MAKVNTKDLSNANSSRAKLNAHDAYCWSCHNLKTTIFCSTCPRTYHSLCSGNNENGKNEWRCDCCLKLEKARSNWAKWKFDSNSLKIALERTLDDAKELKKVFNIVSPKDQNENKLINPIDLDKIKEKVEANEYKTPEEFFVDIKWAQHNVFIIHPNNPKYEKVTTKFVAECELELISLSHCTECYKRSESRARNWFTAYCIPPHLPIWAKYSTYPYWPGKLMSADDKMVDVQFFGDHTFETVPVDNCLIYSEQHPEKETFQFRSDFEDAQEECKKYIKRLKARFGAFNYGKDGEKLNLKKMKYHLENMIPKLQDNGESIEIQFKRLTPMDKSLLMYVDDSPLNNSDSYSSTKWAMHFEDSSVVDEVEIENVDSQKDAEKMIDAPIDLVELEIQKIFGMDEPEKVNDESDPLRMDFESNDNVNEQSTDKSKSSTVNQLKASQSNDECNGEPNVKEIGKSLKRNSISVSAQMSKRMRRNGTECNHVNSSERPQSSCSCESVFSQDTVHFDFDKQKITDKIPAAVEQPVPSVPNHNCVHSTQLTPPPNVGSESIGGFGLDLPIRAYIEALERLQNELLTENMKYEKQLKHMQEENKKLREENISLVKKC